MKYISLTNELVETSAESFLIDFQGEGEVLIVSFGFYDYTSTPSFDFYKQVKKLEVLSGRKVNKLLLRDVKNQWYLKGIPGLGDNIDSTIKAIRKIIAEMKPSKVITVGQSMGGYGAILYGLLLGADEVISYGPLSCFDSKKLEIMHDYRWMVVVKQLEANKPVKFYNNLPELIRNYKSKTPDMRILYGTKPGCLPADRNEAVNHDVGHAVQFYGLKGVKLYPFHNSSHAIIQYLKINNVINEIMLNFLFDTKLVGSSLPGVNAEWQIWLADNLSQSCALNDLVDVMSSNGFTKETASAAVENAQLQYELAEYFQ